jgi:hypothetical protein
MDIAIPDRQQTDEEEVDTVKVSRRIDLLPLTDHEQRRAAQLKRYGEEKGHEEGQPSFFVFGGGQDAAHEVEFLFAALGGGEARVRAEVGFDEGREADGLVPLLDLACCRGATQLRDSGGAELAAAFEDEGADAAYDLLLQDPYASAGDFSSLTK